MQSKFTVEYLFIIIFSTIELNSKYNDLLYFFCFI